MLNEDISAVHGYLTLAVTTGKIGYTLLAEGCRSSKHASVGMVGDVERLCCCSTISTTFISALGRKSVHLQKRMGVGEGAG